MKTSLPKRIQRKRTKGWEMPENTVYVGRPTKWGNPFKIYGDMVYMDNSWRRKIMDKWTYLADGKNMFYIVWLYRLLFRGNQQWLCYEDLQKSHRDFDHWQKHFESLDLSELKGKNLACFCPLDAPCHADVLLELANK